jgi:hypothetical protein
MRTVQRRSIQILWGYSRTLISASDLLGFALDGTGRTGTIRELHGSIALLARALRSAIPAVPD